MSKNDNKKTVFQNFVDKYNLSFGVSAYFNTASEVDRFLADTEAAFEKDPKLRTAVQSDHGGRTACVAVKAAAAVGLSLNPALKQAYLSVFKNSRKSTNGNDVYDVAFVKQRDGYIEIALRTGNIAIMSSGLVYQNDKVVFKSTIDGDIFEIEQDLDDRGDVRGAVAKMKTKAGECSAVYMSIKDMERHRTMWHSRQYNGKYISQLWWDPKTFPMMGEKTCLKQLCEKNNIPTDELPKEIQDEFDSLGVQREMIPEHETSVSDQVADDMESEDEQPNDGRRDMF